MDDGNDGDEEDDDGDDDWMMGMMGIKVLWTTMGMLRLCYHSISKSRQSLLFGNTQVLRRAWSIPGASVFSGNNADTLFTHPQPD